MCRKLLLFLVLVIGLAAGNQAAAETIYYDNFDGSAGVDLNGTTPDISLTGASWVAGSNDFDADGTVTWDGAVEGDSAYLPFVAASGYVYTLSATIQAVSAVNDTNWIALGFTQSNGNPDSRFYGDNGSRSPIYWALSRTNQATLYDQDFNGPDTGGGLDFNTISADNLKIVLDTSATTWTASWYFNDNLHRTVDVTDAQKSNFQYVAISNNKASGSIDDFLLTEELGPRAANPHPSENVGGVSKDEDLSWTPGKYADKHDVYFGTDVTKVTDANRANQLGVLVSENQDANSYEPGTLAFGTNYYWRIDEVNDPNIWKGNVWSFTTLAQPGILYYDNFDGPADVNLNGTTPDITTADANWTAGTWVNADGNYGGDPPGDDGRSFTAYLPFTPTPGSVYELTAEVNNTGNDWMAIGFLNTASPDEGIRFGYGSNSSALWMLVRGKASAPSTDKDQAFIGPSTNNGMGNASTFSVNNLKVRVEMISSTEWVVKWYFDGSKEFETTINPVTIPGGPITIQHVAFGSNGMFSACYGNISSFQFLEIPQALKPNPENGELIYTTDVTLHWQPGKYVDDHDVYVGESYDEVSNATPDTPVIYKGQQDANNYPLTGLTQGTTYYWRIDEVNMAEDPNTWKGDVWSFKVQPFTAFNPSPPDGAKYMNPDVNLGWSPGAKAEFHDVYLGTSFNDVNNATRDVNLGVLVSQNQGPNTYEPPGTLDYNTTYYWRIDEVNDPSIWKGDVWSFKTRPDIPITDPNLIGWWPFDEDWGTVALDWSGYGKDGTLINGPVWEAGYKDGALEFDGIDDQVSLPIGEDINSLTSSTYMTWVNFSDRGADTQRIFDFGTSTTDYMYLTPRVGQTEPMEFVINSGTTQSLITATTGTLATGWHHVAVVIKDGDPNTMQLYLDASVVASGSTALLPTDLGVTTGNWLGRSQAGDYTWFTGRLDDFRIYDYALTAEEIEQIGAPPWAWGPSPADGATDVPLELTLTWKRGKYAASVNGHELYFSSNFDDVNNRTATKIVLSDPCYPIPSPLDLGRTYYWAVDEVNDPNIWEGAVWSFTTRDYLVVEDFDSYAGSGPLTDVWKHYADNGSRAQVSIMTPTIDANLVQDGNSMEYWYGNLGSPYYAEADAYTTGPNSLPGPPSGSDWTSGGVKALVMSFYGQSGNDANEQMYVRLYDADSNAVVTYGDYGEDPNDLRVEEWQEWNIDLEDFNSAGVDLTNVTRITIGFGDKGGSGGDGTVYFENIGLYAPRCVPSLSKPAGDIDNDCDVDYDDLDAIANNWLISDYNVTPQNPGTTGLVAYYDFEGDFLDISGNDNHGDPCGSVSIISSGDPCRGQVASFDGNSYVGLPIGDDINSMTNSTFMTWADFSNDGGAWQRIFDFGNDVNEYMFLSPRIGTDGVMRFALTITSFNDEDMVDAPNTLASGWHHVAVTIDADNDILSLYLDGLLVDENTDANLTPSDLGVTTNNWLGRSQYAADANYMGSLDDFRIYDRALSQGEVAWIYGFRDEFTQPLYLLLIPANPDINSYVDGTIDFKDYAAMTNWWLEEQLWP